jgi:cell division protein FtsI (penicillin-binding protein 3)
MSRRRLAAVALTFALVLTGLALRAFDLCVLNAETFGPQAMRQALRDLQLTGPRGDIVDRFGAPLAVSLQVPSVYANPRALEDRSRAALGLAQALKSRFEEIFPFLTGDRGFVWVRRWLDPEQAERVEALRERGITVVQEPRRYYPGRELAAHLLGFVGRDGNGLEGLEKTFDAELRGAPLTLSTLRDARGRELTVGGVPPPATAGAGRTLVLTIDRAVQFLTEEALRRAVHETQARRATAVVLEPRTGEIRALANLPTYNPNVPGSSSQQERRNLAVADSFEAGSTMKVFTVATALEARAVTPQERFFCERGSWKFGSHRIRDVHAAGHLPVTDVVKFSSNICAAKIGLRLGAHRLHEGLRRFLFGEPTGLGLPGEASGTLHTPDRWRPSGVVTHSYGYGVSVTALQLAQAYAAIANGGEIVRPRLVRTVLDPHGALVHRVEREVRGRAVSTETARVLTRMMVRVTEKGGTGHRAAIDGHEVAGKTGTAYKAGPGGYSTEKRVALFAGFVPAQDPRLVAVVVLDEPKGKVTGGLVAAPVWREIAEGALRLWGVPPSVSGPAPTELARRPPTTPASPWAGPDPRPRAAPGAVPDLRGLGLGSALKATASSGLILEAQGSGLAVRQDPAPGTPLVPGALVRVTFTGEEPFAGGER